MTTQNSINANSTTPLPIPNGGTGVNAVTIVPTASAWAAWDANKNLSANNLLNAYTTTATSGGSTVLTVASTYQQFFTGTSAQTVTMPVTSTLVLGQSYLVVNNSTNTVTVQSSGNNTITALAANTSAIFTCILTSGTTAASWSSDYQATNIPLIVSEGGTGNTSATAYAPIVGGTTSTAPFQSVAVGSANQVLQSGGNAAVPVYSTATYPATSTINQLLYSSSNNAIGGLATNNSSVLVTSGGGVPSLSTALPSGLTATNMTLTTPALGTPSSGTLTNCTGLPATTGITGVLPIANGGTAVNAVTISPTATSWAGWDANKNLSANNYISGYTSTATAASTTTLVVGSAQQQFFTGSTTQTVKLPDVTTLPALGFTFLIVNNSTGVVTVQSNGSNTITAMASSTVAVYTNVSLTVNTAAGWNSDYETAGVTFPVNLANGGTNAALTASNGGIFYSTGSAGAILAGTSTAGQLLTSGASTTPAWTTATYPATAAINTLLYASSANVISALATQNSSGLLTNGSGVPAWVTVTGTGAPVLATSATLVTPTLGAATATSITFSPTTGGIVGTTTNDNANAGTVGEYVTATAGPISITTATAKTITSISLTAGDWDVYGNAQITPAGTTTVQQFNACTTTSNNTFTGNLSSVTLQNTNWTVGDEQTVPVGYNRYSLPTTTTIYLVVDVSFSVSTCTAAAIIAARRAR